MTSYRSPTHKPSKEDKEIDDLRRGLETILKKLRRIGCCYVTIRGVKINLEAMWERKNEIY